MQAAVECADPELRRMLVKGATNCSEQAYELFQLMNQKGWYQVPTLQPNTTQTMTSMYQPARDTRPNRNIEQHQPELFGASSVGVPHANMEPVNAGRAGIPQS
jgi:hypothetical protein